MPIRDADWLNAHSGLLIDSYFRVTGRRLLPENGGDATEAAADSDRIGEGIGKGIDTPVSALFRAPFALLSHGTESDPVLNYGNRLALELWERDWHAFTSMPSRLTAEPGERAQRAKLIDDVKSQGYSDGYTGIRISASGRRFEIRRATIWNVFDERGIYRGQAAMFAEWSQVPGNS